MTTQTHSCPGLLLVMRIRRRRSVSGISLIRLSSEQLSVGDRHEVYQDGLLLVLGLRFLVLVCLNSLGGALLDLARAFGIWWVQKNLVY